MANVTRLVESAMVPPLAKEVAAQIDAAISSKAQIAALTAIATADATDLATVLVLANATKAKVNQIITALKS
jgi:hypothetical protein